MDQVAGDEPVWRILRNRALIGVFSLMSTRPVKEAETLAVPVWAVAYGYVATDCA